jgi:hypothetical protein
MIVSFMHYSPWLRRIYVRIADSLDFFVIWLSTCIARSAFA